MGKRRFAQAHNGALHVGGQPRGQPFHVVFNGASFTIVKVDELDPNSASFRVPRTSHMDDFRPQREPSIGRLDGDADRALEGRGSAVSIKRPPFEISRIHTGLRALRPSTLSSTCWWSINRGCRRILGRGPPSGPFGRISDTSRHRSKRGRSRLSLLGVAKMPTAGDPSIEVQEVQDLQCVLALGRNLLRQA